MAHEHQQDDDPDNDKRPGNTWTLANDAALRPQADIQGDAFGHRDPATHLFSGGKHGLTIGVLPQQRAGLAQYTAHEAVGQDRL